MPVERRMLRISSMETRVSNRSRRMPDSKKVLAALLTAIFAFRVDPTYTLTETTFLWNPGNVAHVCLQQCATPAPPDPISRYPGVTSSSLLVTSYPLDVSHGRINPTKVSSVHTSILD